MGLRHREHLTYLMTSKREEMKRKLLGLIDTIHTQEQAELSEDIGKVQQLMKGWQRADYEPVSFDVVIEQKLQQMEKEREENLALEEQLASCDTYTKTQEKIKFLSNLC